MNSKDVGKLVDCATFKRSIYHFQADEVPENERQELERHLSDCDACAERLAFEDSMLSGLKARLAPEVAPPGLETRIRASLARPSVSGGLMSWLRAPWSVAAIAGAFLLALLTLPSGGLGSVVVGGGEAVATHVTVVDLDCHRAGKSLAQQRGCRHDKHVNALELADGTIWNLSLAQEAARRMALDRSLRGHELVVRGNYYAQLETVWVTESSDLGNKL